MSKKKTDDLKKIKNLLDEDILEEDANNFEKLEIALKKHLNNIDSFVVAKKEITTSYEELVATANDFFKKEKLQESIEVIENPLTIKEVNSILRRHSSTQDLSLEILKKPYDNESTRIKVEEEINLIIQLHQNVDKKYKKVTFGSKFKSFWDDCTK